MAEYGGGTVVRKDGTYEKSEPLTLADVWCNDPKAGIRAEGPPSGGGGGGCTTTVWYTVDLSREFVHGLDYIDEHVAQYTGTGAKWYVIQDANYDVVGFLYADGSVSEQYAHYPYGEFQAIENSAGNPRDTWVARVFHQGLWRDKETGNYYNRVRYYMTPLGRFNSRDPNGIALLVTGDLLRSGASPTAEPSSRSRASRPQ
ncbi:MAG: RHS repeat-associated core domain-containing protein [Phycisphaerae bacterium]